jgi:lipopolysaccharide transport system ATP-binding protein
VLAVGDAGFQKKCLGKMGEVSRGGRTILFVSHNMQAIRGLCPRSILLDRGSCTAVGPSEQVIPAYLAAQSEHDVTGVGLADRLNRTSGDALFEEVRAEGPDGAPRWIFTEGEDVRIRLTCRTNRSVPGLGVYLAILAATGDVVTNFKTPLVPQPLAPGNRVELTLELPRLALRPGEYRLYICLGDPRCARWYDVIDENVRLPWLIVRATTDDLHLTRGYFTHPGAWSIRVLDREPR